MTLVQVRDVPEATVAALRNRAAEQRLTLAVFLRAELERIAARPTNAEIVARLKRQDPGPMGRRPAPRQP